MRLCRRTNYPRSICLSDNEYVDIAIGKYKSIIAVDYKTGVVIKEIKDLGALLETAARIPKKNKVTGKVTYSKYVVVKF